MPHVTAIHIGPEAEGPLQSLDEIKAVAGKGLEGDRKYDSGEHRAITVVSEAELADAAAEWGYEIPTGSTRRNVTVSDVRLPRERGARITLGDVVVEVHQDCAPCYKMEASVGPGAQEALQLRAGIRGAILEGGLIRVGDEVSV